MSSPKRAHKGVTKRAGEPGAESAVIPADASTQAQDLAAALERGIAAGQLDLLSAEALQALLAAACRVYGARREAGEELTPVKPNAVSATDAMFTASGLLRAADLSTFELGMWQSWTGR
jgi:hypothetical protein